MTDLNRLQDETHGEPRVEADAPSASADAGRAAAPTADTTDGNATEASAPEASAAGATRADGEARPDGEAPRKKRRRGTRGGQGRKKPGSTAGGAARTGGAGTARDSDGETDDDDDADDDAGDSLVGSEDWTAESADRGLTDDDIGEQAREDAGLTRPAPALRPKIGDSRPAPAAGTANGDEADGASSGSRNADDGPALGPDGQPKKRRRRRGGRGRSKGGGQGGQGTQAQDPEQTGQRRAAAPTQSAAVARVGAEAVRAGVRSSTSTPVSSAMSMSTAPRCSTRSTRKRFPGAGAPVARAAPRVGTSWSCTCAPTDSRTSACSKAAS